MEEGDNEKVNLPFLAAHPGIHHFAGTSAAVLHNRVNETFLDDIKEVGIILSLDHTGQGFFGLGFEVGENIAEHPSASVRLLVVQLRGRRYSFIVGFDFLITLISMSTFS